MLLDAKAIPLKRNKALETQASIPCVSLIYYEQVLPALINEDVLTPQ
jgi:hypothetical protein